MELKRFAQGIKEDIETYLDDPPYDEADRKAALTDILLEYLEDCGALNHVPDDNPCPHDDGAIKGRCRIYGYCFNDDHSELILFYGHEAPQVLDSLPHSETKKIATSIARFYEHSVKEHFKRFEGNMAALEAAKEIHNNHSKINKVTVILLTDAIIRDRHIDKLSINNTDIQFEIFDIERIFRIQSSGSIRPEIFIDFTEISGRPLPCLDMKHQSQEYQSYLAVFPGELLFQLYDQYGPQLLEFNVRSYLQARGKVNKGILETLKNEPERFMAYNNGLAATVDEIDVSIFHGETCINSIRGLQIVNGGQTTASIHRAKKELKIDIERVSVPVKISRVEQDKLQEFVPLISKYSNMQNVIQVADLSANHEFHVAVDKLARSVWCPGEKTKWFYERARGAYQVEYNTYGTTMAKKKEFKKMIPTWNKFTKTDMAKYLMSWLGWPQSVSRGAQKNFAAFMDELPEMFPVDWEPDANFFRELVAKAILFKRTDRVVKRAGHAYKANIVTYLIAYLSKRVFGQLNFETIWKSQDISDGLNDLLADWCDPIFQQIVETAEGRNVSEWCKKSECWHNIASLELPLPEILPPELVMNDEEEEEEEPVIDEENIDIEWQEAFKHRGKGLELCKRVSASNWARIAYWGVATKRLNRWERGVAFSLSEMAFAEWNREPSVKQLPFALKALELAVKDEVVEL